MQSIEVAESFGSLDGKVNVAEYNFDHFRTKHLLSDLKATLEKRGLEPGVSAPTFELARVGGGTLRSNELLGQPALLHFGSYT